MLPGGKHVSLHAYTGGRNGFFSIYNFVPFVLRGHKAFINFANRGWARSCSPLHTRHHPLINKFILILEVFVHERNFFHFLLFLRINLLREVSREKWIFNQCPLCTEINISLNCSSDFVAAYRGCINYIIRGMNFLSYS